MELMLLPVLVSQQELLQKVLPWELGWLSKWTSTLLPWVWAYLFTSVMEGWRVGWAIAPAVINAAIQNIHVKLTDSAPAPFQEAALVALQSSPSFYAQLQQVCF
jgi:hypothetical protein